MKKQGSFLDLPISLGILRDKIRAKDKEMIDSVFVGELSLDGTVKSIKGILPIVIGARENGYEKIFIPRDNFKECSFIDDIEIVPVNSLKNCISILNGGITKLEIEGVKSEILKDEEQNHTEDEKIDFSDIKGNTYVKRCAEIAVAGGHNMLMIGPPGSGKSFLAKRMTTILPDMTRDEMLEVSRIYSVCSNSVERSGLIERRPFSGKSFLAKRMTTILPDMTRDEMLEVSRIYSVCSNSVERSGLIERRPFRAPHHTSTGISTILPDMTRDEMLEVSRIYSVCSNSVERSGLIERRPFRAPHHTSTGISLIGGGTDAKAGEITLAHKGILFLDEVAEFNRKTLESLRQPIEEKSVNISRLGTDAKAGEITLAHKGILFLDEVAEFNRKTLESLRQPIEEKSVNISRLKYSVTYPSDFILVAAMNPCPCGI